MFFPRNILYLTMSWLSHIISIVQPFDILSEFFIYSRTEKEIEYQEKISNILIVNELSKQRSDYFFFLSYKIMFVKL